MTDRFFDNMGRHLSRMGRDIDSFFESVTESVTDYEFATKSAPAPVRRQYEVTEDSESQLTIEIDAPGIKKADLDVEITDEGFYVTGRREIHGGHKKLKAKFTLGEDIDRDSITASLADGVLTVQAKKIKRVPVPPATRKIPIT